MERGFKSRCEKMALNLRRELGLTRTGPLPPKALADYLDVRILTLDDIGGVSSSDKRTLLVDDPDSWSAITVSVGGRDAIIANSSHRGGRPATDLMHELAHLLLGHEPSKFVFTGDGQFVLRGYSEEHEEEATWLANTLLLPRDALLSIRAKGLTTSEACALYGVSKDLLRYRLDITGVNRQLGSRRTTR